MELKLLKGMRRGNRKMRKISLKLKRIFKIIILLWFSILIDDFGFSQTDYDNLTTQNSSSLTKSSGNIGLNNVDKTTGRLSTSIPIYEFIGRELNLPISLNYYADGIRVDEIASNVGLGWELNVGGKISRIVNTEQDDANVTGAYPGDPTKDYYKLNAFGYEDYLRFTKYCLHSVSKPQVKISLIGNNSGTEFVEVVVTIDDGTKMYFGQNNVNDIIENGPPVPFVSGGTNPDLLSKNSWHLTKITSKNQKDEYVFKYESYEWLYNINNNGNTTYKEITGLLGSYSTRNSYYKIKRQQVVKEIFHNGSKIIDFSYQSRSDILFVGGENIGNALDEIRFFEYKSSNIYKKVKFEYSYFGNSLSTNYLEKRLKLDKIIFKSRNASNVFLENDVYSFEYKYSNLLPSITSYAQDYLGLYNGKDSNLNLFPGGPIDADATINLNEPVGFGPRGYDLEKSLTGILEKITYPSKGFSEFKYEQNALNGGYGKIWVDAASTINEFIGDGFPFLLRASTNLRCNQAPSVPHQMMQHLNLTNFGISGQSTLKNCHAVKTGLLRVGQNNGNNFMMELDGNGIYLIQKISSCDDNLDTSLQCTVEIEQIYDVTHNPCLRDPTQIYFNGLTSSNPEDFIMGGYTGLVDVPRKISLPEGNYQITCWSFYSYYSDIKLNKISYNTVTIPGYYKNLDVTSNFTDGFRIKSILNYDNSSNLINTKDFKYSLAFRTSKVHNYDRRTLIGESGGYDITITSRGYSDSNFIKYLRTFEINKDKNNENLGYVCIRNTPSIFQTQTTANDYNLVEYPLLQDIDGEQFESSFWFNNYPIIYEDDSLKPISIVFNPLNDFKICKKSVFNKEGLLIGEENFGYGYSGFINQITCESNNPMLKEFYGTEFLESKYTVSYPNPADPTRKIVNQTFFNYDNGFAYKNNEETHKPYAEVLNNIVTDKFTERYGYNHPLSLSDVNCRRIPTDIINSITGYTSYIHTTFIDNRVTPNITRYLVSEVQHQPVNGTALEPKTRYNYDLDGNMIEMVNVTPGVIPNNQYESYIYGYNNRFIVAKITGARYSDIPVANITAIKNASNQIINAANNTAMETALNALRGVPALANAQITTTTINPVFGPTSITDPKGYTIYSEYDVFGRLALTKEKNPLVTGGFNILSETKFNTRPN